MIIPESVTYIGDGAFAGCAQLEHIQLPKDVQLGKGVFEDCTALQDLLAVTAPPANASDNSAPQGMDREAWLATLSEDQRKAEKLTGHTVEELYAAIGEPEDAEYTASSLVEGGEDGILAYDGFYVSTTRFTNGVEHVMGTSSDKSE